MAKAMTLFRMVMLSLSILILATLTAADATTPPKVIDYGAIGRDRIPCSRKISPDPNACAKGPPANSYQRGCNKIDRCRGPDSANDDAVNGASDYENDPNSANGDAGNGACNYENDTVNGN